MYNNYGQTPFYYSNSFATNPYRSNPYTNIRNFYQNNGINQMMRQSNPYQMIDQQSYWPSYYSNQFSANPYAEDIFEDDSVIQMIRQYAPYQMDDEFGNKIMYQGYNGEQVLYKPPASHRYAKDYHQPLLVMFSAEPAELSVRSGIEEYNPYLLPTYQAVVKEAFVNTHKIPNLDPTLFKLLDALSPYHFLNSISSDAFEAILQNDDNTNSTLPQQNSTLPQQNSTITE